MKLPKIASELITLLKINTCTEVLDVQFHFLWILVSTYHNLLPKQKYCAYISQDLAFRMVLVSELEHGVRVYCALLAGNLLILLLD